MTLRGVDWLLVLMGSTIGTAIFGACVLCASAGPPLRFVRLALIMLVAAVAFVLDEPAAAAVDAVPASRLRRTAVRVTVVALPFAVWGSGVLALEQRNAVTQARALLVEGAGACAVAVALAAAFLRLAGRSEPGEIVASVLGAAMLAVLIVEPPPRRAPLFPSDEGWAASTALWISVGVAAVALAVAASRDPYRRP